MTKPRRAEPAKPAAAASHPRTLIIEELQKKYAPVICPNPRCTAGPVVEVSRDFLVARGELVLTCECGTMYRVTSALVEEC